MKGQQAFFEALLDPDRPPPSGLTTWNGADPAARFAVYRNNVVSSLINALVDTFPVTQELVGELFFGAMARLFVSKEPPRSQVLTFYGEAFPTFIQNFAPAAAVPYLADVARLEMLEVHAYHAHDADALPASALVSALEDVDELPNLRIGFHPSVRLLRSQYAVVSLWAAHQGIADIATVDPYLPDNALVIRSQLNVEIINLTAGASNFVANLLLGTCLGSAAERASAAHPDFDLTSILVLLVRVNAISSIQTSKKAAP
ncbi:HvfC/BufC N-terminal domain-containing protein [Glaciimonas immobilis]|uniref:Putative DNA-binding domain-containing protein n=1 Tax=Glaciimonas immobilis TaxID=728004 RepID=A0A840RRJ5_9BURK|nr:DNA-binding domain-containing protein [Glaciimonas immobilis]KAF3996536.1 DUF2063 domain-containing protein [Glaciimonas immobilis]MBB5201097.1 hypothetical protein [Glaciimonas immobilis]